MSAIFSDHKVVAGIRWVYLKSSPPRFNKHIGLSFKHIDMNVTYFHKVNLSHDNALCVDNLLIYLLLCLIDIDK